MAGLITDEQAEGCGIIVSVAGAILIASPFLFMLFVQYIPSWFPGSRPAHLPADAVSTYNFKIGTSWQFCRALPSGRAVFMGSFLILEQGRACGDALEETYEPSFEPARPAATVWKPGHVILPNSPDRKPTIGGECEHRFDRAYIAGVRRLVREAGQDRDIRSRIGGALGGVADNLADYAPDRMRDAGTPGCSLGEVR